MSGAAFLRIKRLKGSGIITVAARHNRRVIQAELGAAGSIDPTRSCLNEILAGPSTAGEVGQLAKDFMKAASVGKLRKDAVMGIEFVFSLPPGHALDDRAYFTACAEWVGATFGGTQNILSVDIHRDEAAPHCHVLLLPLINGRMVGSDLHGGTQKLLALQKDFHAAVASKFGLSKAPAKLSGTAKQAGAKSVLLHLRDRADPVLKSPGWPAYRDAIEAAPASFLRAYGLEQAALKKPGRTTAQIFTSKGKGRAKETSNPIGFAPPEKEQTLCSVGFTSKPPVSNASSLPARPAPASLPDDSHALEIVRVKDCDLDPAMYDTTTGEFFKRPPSLALSQRQAADAWVAAALMTEMTNAAP